MLSTVDFSRRVVIVLALTVAVLAIWRIAEYLLLGFGGIVFAVVIRAAAKALCRVLPIPPRWASLLVVFVLVGSAALAVVLLGDELARQVTSLRESLPGMVARLRSTLEGSEIGRAILSMLGGTASQRMGTSMALGAVSLLFSALSDLAIVLFIALYLSISPRSYIHGVIALVPARHRDTARGTLDDTSNALRDWMVGQLVAMSFVAVLTGVGLWLVGVPHALSLGLLAGLLDFVPVLGPIVAAIPGVLIAYVAGPQAALYAAAVYLVVQQLEGALIMPLAQKWAVQLPPVIGLLAVVVFGALFGVPGFLFGVPLTVVIMVLVKRFYLDRQKPVQAQ